MTVENAQPDGPSLDANGFLAGESAPLEAPITSEPPKPRRGRPPKNPDLAGEKPGQPKTAQAKPVKRGQKMTQEQMTLLARQLAGLHLMAASITKVGELQISDSDSQVLAQGISAVAEEYGLALDGKTGAALQLFGACAMIYVPRFIMFKQRMAIQARTGVSDATVVQSA